MHNKEKRYFLIDGIRGAAIINMVLFHFYMIYSLFMKEIRYGTIVCQYTFGNK